MGTGLNGYCCVILILWVHRDKSHSHARSGLHKASDNKRLWQSSSYRNYSDGTSKIPGELVIAFAKYLEHSGLFEEVYCPTRSGDKFNLSLDSKIDVKFNANSGPNMAKSFITGLSLFVLEPIFWYEHNIDFSGHVDIRKEGKTVSSFDAKTKADLYRKFLSLGDTDAFQKKLWPAGLRATFAQLLREIETYCKHSLGETIQRQ